MYFKHPENKYKCLTTISLHIAPYGNKKKKKKAEKNEASEIRK